MAKGCWKVAAGVTAGVVSLVVIKKTFFPSTQSPWEKCRDKKEKAKQLNVTAENSELETISK